jgi:glutamyl-tRNA reductase
VAIPPEIPARAPALVLVGTNHRHAPLAVRERLAVEAHGRELMEGVLTDPAVAEAIALSTCNRCELYLVGDEADALAGVALERLAGYARQPRERLEAMIYVHRGVPAAAHLFAVAGGLDSLVPGEAQILSQIRDAHARARDARTAGPVSNRLFHAAVEAGKRVRSETAIGERGASVASVAAELVRRRLGDLDGLSVVLVGAGKVAELVAGHLLARGAVRLAIANRDPARAEALAARFGGRAAALPFAGLAAAIDGADVVVGSTASPEPVIRAADVRPGRRRVLVDLAVPRDIEPATAAVPGVTLVNVDDLEATVQANIRIRRGEAERAEAIVNEEAAEFGRWLAALGVVPAITSLRALAEQIRTAELERVAPKWESLTPHDRARLDRVTQVMVNKLLHRPTVRLKELAAEDDSDDYARAVTELFGLQ